MRRTSLMHRRRVKFTLTMLAAGLVVVTLAALALNEPAYQGRGVRGWLREFDAHAKEASAAFRQIGPAALPILEHELRARDVPWQTNLIAIGHSWFRLEVPYTLAATRRQRAVRACEALGPAAKPAIPALGVALGYGTSDALRVLKLFGPDAAASLAVALTNAPGCSPPYGTALALGALGAPARVAVTNLIWEYEHYHVSYPRIASAVAAGDICFDLIEHAHEPGAPEVAFVKAALTRGLGDTNQVRLQGAALGLERFRTHAREVAPALRALERHPDELIRDSASKALAAVTSESPSAAARVRQ